MDFSNLAMVLLLLLFFAAVVQARRRRKRGGGLGHPGPGAAGALYDMLNEDKRRAIAVIVEEKTGERDPEDADGNLPELESPGRRGT
ncbi:MAG TPA: hypothetical protein VI485_31435 [Vicinamibacterales bacterium]|nr:hypothetical protein [Vicinamibacterales bacterium]